MKTLIQDILIVLLVVALAACAYLYRELHDARKTIAIQAQTIQHDQELAEASEDRFNKSSLYLAQAQDLLKQAQATIANSKSNPHLPSHTKTPGKTSAKVN